MSILSTLDNMVLFNTNHPPLGNKAGVALTPAEWDARITAIYDAIQSIVSGANVTAYDAGRTYDQYSTNVYDQFASYDSRIWKAVYNGSPSTFTGQTPAEGVYWTQVTLAEMLPDVMKLADLSTSSGVVIKQSVISIPSADVLTGNATPVNLNIPRSSGQTIVPSHITAAIISSTTPYATNTTIAVRYVGADTDMFTSDMLARTDANAVLMQPNYTVGAAQTQILSNTDLEVYVKTGNPTAGDGVLVLGVTYNIG